MPESTDLAALAEWAAEHTEDVVRPWQVVDGVVVAAVPPGWDLRSVDVDRTLPYPRRRSGTVTLITVTSLIDFLKRHADDAACCYVDPQSLRFVAVLNDHYEEAGWRDHRAVLQLEATPAWLRWSGANRTMLDQEAFAELVEDGLAEIVTPDGADVLELAQSMHATTAAKFRSDRRLANGRVQLEYVEEVDARAGADGSMVIPSEIVLAVSPFAGSEPVEVRARLRYRLHGGKLTLGIVLNQPEQVVWTALEHEAERVSTETGVLVVWGQP